MTTRIYVNTGTKMGLGRNEGKSNDLCRLELRQGTALYPKTFDENKNLFRRRFLAVIQMGSP